MTQTSSQKGQVKLNKTLNSVCVRLYACVCVRVCVWVCIRPVASQQDQKEPVSSSTQPPSNDLPA